MKIPNLPNIKLNNFIETKLQDDENFKKITFNPNGSHFRIIFIQL